MLSIDPHDQRQVVLGNPALLRLFKSTLLGVLPAFFCTRERILSRELNNASGWLNFPILLQRTGNCSSSDFLPTLPLSPTNPTESFYGKRAAHTSSTHWSISKMLQPRCGLRGCISPSGVCSTMSPHLLSTYTSIPPALFIKSFWPCSQSKFFASSSSAHWRHSPYWRDLREFCVVSPGLSTPHG